MSLNYELISGLIFESRRVFIIQLSLNGWIQELDTKFSIPKLSRGNFIPKPRDLVYSWGRVRGTDNWESESGLSEGTASCSQKSLGGETKEGKGFSPSWSLLCEEPRTQAPAATNRTSRLCLYYAMVDWIWRCASNKPAFSQIASVRRFGFSNRKAMNTKAGAEGNAFTWISVLRPPFLLFSVLV